MTNVKLDGRKLACTVRNTGKFNCDEVLQVYLTQPQADYENPVKSLIRTERFNLSAGEEKEITFNLDDKDFYSFNENGDTVLLRGKYALTAEDGQNIKSEKIYFNNDNETIIVEKCPV